MTQEPIGPAAARHAFEHFRLGAVDAIPIGRLALSSLTIKRARIGSLQVAELWGLQPPTT